MIKKAREEDRREKLYTLWAGCYPHFDQKSFISFEDFIEKVSPQKIELDTRDFDELMGMAKSVETEIT